MARITTPGQKRVTHGFTGTPTYSTWSCMRQRCYNPHHPNYKHYGAKGIKICDYWEDFENFLSDMGERPLGMSIDRINNDGHYTPSNCRWATPKQQLLNRRWQPIGERHGSHKLTTEQVLEIRAFPNVRLLDFANRFGVNISTISDIRNRKKWRHI